MSRTRALLELQTVDQQRAQVATRLAQVERRLAGPSAVADARARLDKATADQERIDKALRATQTERQTQKSHIATEERKLYGGQVTAPKELQNLQREIDSLRRRLAEHDDKALELMLARDEAEAAVAAARQALAECESGEATERAALTAERDKLRAAQTRLEPVRAQAAAGVPPADLALYDRLWRKHPGRPLAPVHGEHCGACGIQLLRRVLDQVAGGHDLVQCGHCGRILHAPS